MIKRLNIAAFMLCTPVTFSTIAATDDAFFTPEKVTAGLSIGTLSGQTRERVYDDPEDGGRKLSQLDWKYNNAAVAKGSVEWDLLPLISLGASGWTTLAGRGGRMDDYDWEIDTQEKWTDHSSHPNTKLNYANQFDLNIKSWIFNEPEWRVGLMAGYQESRYSFHSKGGTYNYNNGQDIGEWPADIIGIGYQQKFRMPYIGITGKYRYNDFEMSGMFKYSGWTRSSDNDEHYLSKQTFNSKVRNQNYFSLSGDIGYYLTDKAKIYLEGSWSRVINKKGDMSVYDHTSGTSESGDDASGIESYSFMTSIGLKYTF